MRHFFEDLADWIKIVALIGVYLMISFFMGTSAQAASLSASESLQCAAVFSDTLPRAPIIARVGRVLKAVHQVSSSELGILSLSLKTKMMDRADADQIIESAKVRSPGAKSITELLNQLGETFEPPPVPTLWKSGRLRSADRDRLNE